MIVTTRMVAFLCCKPSIQGCYAPDLDEAVSHARERAHLTGMRQWVGLRSGWVDLDERNRKWIIVPLPESIKPTTWTFDGRTYRIVDAQS